MPPARVGGEAGIDANPAGFAAHVPVEELVGAALGQTVEQRAQHGVLGDVPVELALDGSPLGPRAGPSLVSLQPAFDGLAPDMQRLGDGELALVENVELLGKPLLPTRELIRCRGPGGLGRFI